MLEEKLKTAKNKKKKGNKISVQRKNRSDYAFWNVSDTERILTQRIQFVQVCFLADRLHDSRLVYPALNFPTLLPLPGAQSKIAPGPVGPIRVLIRNRVREGRAILKPGHRHVLWVETLHIAVKSERHVGGVRWHGRESD